MQNSPYHNIINYLIETHGFNSYLELGVCDNNTFNNVNCENKTGVDINPKSNATFTMSTNEFFASIDSNVKWDIIFIDAEHTKDAVKTDFENAMLHLSNNGFIIIDDINPPSIEFITKDKCNNAWEFFAELRSTRTDLYMFSMQDSFAGVIQRGSQHLFSIPIESTFEFLDTHRQELLNFLSWDEIFERYE